MGAGSGPFGPEALAWNGLMWASPSVAGVYDAWLGGKDNLAVDRDAAEQVAQAQPLVVAGVRANRAFVRRAVAFLAQQGIGQFIDVGSGLPTASNVHEIAGQINRDARTAYVDNDQVVLVHARALLADSPRTIAIEGDAREPESILTNPQLRAHLDFSQPIAVLFAALLHFVTEAECPARIVSAFREVMVPGSGLVITHVVEGGDGGQDAATRRSAEIYAESIAPFVARSREQVAAWFDGFRLVRPGLVPADRWRTTGNSRIVAPIVAGVGLRDGPPR